MHYTIVMEVVMNNETERIMLDIVDYINAGSEGGVLTRIVELQELLEALREQRVQWVRDEYR